MGAHVRFRVVGTLLALCFSVPAPAAAQPACTYRPDAVTVAGIVALFLSAPAAASAAGQTACTYSIFQYDDTFPNRGSASSEGIVRIDTQPGCAWTAESSASFMTPDPTQGVGATVVRFRLAPNFTPTPRSAQLRIADQFLTITQGRGVPIVDFNHDGYFDLLWHNRADGRISTWLMNGTVVQQGPSFIPDRVADTNWRLAGSGDLNADGHPDLVWRHAADGRVSAWLMNGLRLVDGALLGIPQVPDLNWQIRAVADQNGDGRADLFWQHQTQGLVAVWLMDGFTVLEGDLINAPAITDPGWRLAGTSGGGRGNGLVLVWQHDGDGRLASWYLSGRTLAETAPEGQLGDTNWKVRAVGDIDRNGIADYIWQHQVDGRLAVWYRNSTIAERPDLGAVPDTNWRLAGPR